MMTGLGEGKWAAASATMGYQPPEFADYWGQHGLWVSYDAMLKNEFPSAILAHEWGKSKLDDVTVDDDG